MSRNRIEDIIQEHASKLMAISGVIGVGQGMSRGEQCIIVFVQDRLADSLSALPNDIEGYSLVVQESGKFQALGE